MQTNVGEELLASLLPRLCYFSSPLSNEQDHQDVMDLSRLIIRNARNISALPVILRHSLAWCALYLRAL